MAWGDHERSERRQDEQMKQSQGYLTGLQQQMANQYGGISNIYGGGFPQVGNTYGWGTTVPHYSPYGPYFQGNKTDTPYQGGTGFGGQVDQAVPRGANPRNPPMQGQEMQTQGQAPPQQGQLDEAAYQNYQNQFNSLFPGETVSSEMLMANKDKLAAMGMEVQTNAEGRAGKIKLPNGDIIDVVGGGQHGANRKQWTYGPGSPMSTGNFAAGPQTGPGYSGGGGIGAGGVVGRNLADYGNVFGRYEGFADTGGYSEADKANIRARAVSPIRSMYSSARQGMDRQRALQGGYAPGYATAMGRLSREQGQLASDATTNAEAQIAQMVHAGKLAGMGGMASMYGSTPGLSNMFGNQMLTSQDQQLRGAGLQNQLSLGLMGNQNQVGQIPGNLQVGLGAVKDVSEIIGNVGGGMNAWPGGGGAGAASGQYGAVPTSQYDPSKMNWNSSW